MKGKLQNVMGTEGRSTFSWHQKFKKKKKKSLSEEVKSKIRSNSWEEIRSKYWAGGWDDGNKEMG